MVDDHAQSEPPVPGTPPSLRVRREHVVVQFSDKNVLGGAYDHPPLILPSLRMLENAWMGEQVVVWGNGPSALDALRDRPWRTATRHIGTNAAARLSDLTFDAYCIGDIRFLDVPEKRAIAMSAPGVKVYQSQLRPHLGDDHGINYVLTIGRDGFSTDVTQGIFHGFSVAYFALQVAAWSGSTDILLAGCSHDYALSQPRFYAERQPQRPDDNWHRISQNYKSLVPVLAKLGIVVRTLGPSRLQECGVPMA